MKIIYAPEAKEILDWELESGVEITVTELTTFESNQKFCAVIDDCVIRMSATSEYNDFIYVTGATIDQALQFLCSQISRKCCIFFDEDKKLKRAIEIPELTHTKLLNK